jgi:hypothetical protein
MYRKVIFILILAGSVGGFLYFQPFINKKKQFPSIIDRLPTADFLGRCYLLDLANETSSMLFYHKIPFRDFFSQEFLLSQGKSYGLNLQKPVYFFANENGNWGVMIEVSDSSKIYPGILRLNKLLNLKDTLVYQQKSYLYEKENGYLTYDKDWLLVYKGDKYEKQLSQILFAKKGGVKKCWKAFLKEKQFIEEKLVLYSNWKKLKQYGIETALFAHDSDSSSFSLLTYVRNKENFGIKLKDTNSLGWESKFYTNKLLSIHLDIDGFRKKKKDPFYNFLVHSANKISFPMVDFLNAWNGDLSFREGGLYTIKEEYIKTEMDEDFNLVEVKSTKDIRVPGFSLLFSVNEKGDYLMKRLFQKGILRKEQNYYRFLTSPPLSIEKKENYYLFYSGNYPSKISRENSNHGIWLEKGTKVQFSLDSLSSKEIFGSIHIPVDRLIRRNKFF